MDLFCEVNNLLLRGAASTHIVTTDFNPLNKNKIVNECRRHDSYFSYAQTLNLDLYYS